MLLLDGELEPSSEDGELPGDGVEGVAVAGKVMAICKEFTKE